MPEQRSALLADVAVDDALLDRGSLGIDRTFQLDASALKPSQHQLLLLLSHERSETTCELVVTSV
jgi:hypothetical protein